MSPLARSFGQWRARRRRRHRSRGAGLVPRARATVYALFFPGRPSTCCDLSLLEELFNLLSDSKSVFYCSSHNTHLSTRLPKCAAECQNDNERKWRRNSLDAFGAKSKKYLRAKFRRHSRQSRQFFCGKPVGEEQRGAGREAGDAMSQPASPPLKKISLKQAPQKC